MTRKLELVGGNSKVASKAAIYKEENVNGYLEFTSAPLSSAIEGSLDVFLSGMDEGHFGLSFNHFYRRDKETGKVDICPSVSLAKGWIEEIHKDVIWWTPCPSDDIGEEGPTPSLLPRIVNSRILQIEKFLFHCTTLYKKAVYEGYGMIHPAFCRELLVSDEVRRRLDSYHLKPELSTVFYLDYNTPFNFLHTSTFDLISHEIHLIGDI